MRRLLAILFLLPAPVAAAGTAADLARAIRENTFDHEECYRVRDMTLTKDEARFYFTDGHLIFSKPVAGRRIAAVFTADVDGGDAEVIITPPNRAERSTLGRYTGTPNLDEHFKAAVLLFTGDDYEKLRAQLPSNPANKKTPEVAPLLDDEWTPVLRNLGTSYQTRLVLDLIGGPGVRPGLFAALISSRHLNNFDVVFDPDNAEQLFAGQIATGTNSRLFFDTWTSFVSKSFRRAPLSDLDTLKLRDYRIDATIDADLQLSAVTRVKVTPLVDGMRVVRLDISPDMNLSEVTVDGKPAEYLQRESLRLNLTRGGNNLFLVAPPEPLRAEREYEFVLKHSGKVIHAAGDNVFFVSARGNWYPTHGMQFANFDLTFHYPSQLDLVSAGDVVEDHTEGDVRTTRRRTPNPVRTAAFNLGDYVHARVEKGGFIVDVCANKALDKALQSMVRPLSPGPPVLTGPQRPPRRTMDSLVTDAPTPMPSPLERLRTLAAEVASAMEFMAAKFGPPALPHLTVSPIPGTFGQGFPGMVYLSTFSYLRNLPRGVTASQELFFADVLQAHETAHQWWGNRVASASYRDYWLMESLANYSALLYLEKTRNEHPMDLMLDTYRSNLLLKNEAGETVESTGPIALGPRLENSQEPRAYRTITYGKGTWIIHMLRRRMGDERFFSMLADVLKKFDHQEISTEEFRQVASQYLPPKSADPKLEGFFEQWVYGTGIPNLKMSYSLKGKAPALKVVGTVTQSDVDDEFSALVPVDIQLPGKKTVTQWVRTSDGPVTFTVAVAAPPLKVTLDPKRSVLRR